MKPERRNITAKDFIRATIAAGVFLVGASVGLHMLDRWLQSTERDNWPDGWATRGDSTFCEKPVRGTGFGWGSGLYETRCRYSSPLQRTEVEVCVFGNHAEAEASVWRSAWFHETGFGPERASRVESIGPPPDFPEEDIGVMKPEQWFAVLFPPLDPLGEPPYYWRITFYRRNVDRKLAWCATDGIWGPRDALFRTDAQLARKRKGPPQRSSSRGLALMEAYLRMRRR